MTTQEGHDLLKLFKVPEYPGVYVLGCFARYATLYSQQVRALNLITALSVTGEIRDGTEVAVVGGGAGGMTAAAGAAVRRAKVLLLEELQGFLELQRNNRQRWIHPHIYDWPDMEFDSEEAKLPLLSWTAGYAESVARQIEDGFDALRRTVPIDVRTSVSKVRIIRGDSSRLTSLTWRDKGSGGDSAFRVIILAPGFGLEPESDVEDSYLAEDDIDGGFRKSASGQKWLISGSGDGAYTDLIRLCIRRFRHAEIKDLFASERGYLGVIDDLREIHKGEPSDEALSDKFKRISAAHLQETLKGRLRSDGLDVVLTAKSPHLYGRNASILNRLIVLLLSPGRLGRFTFTPGPFVGAEKTRLAGGSKFVVTFGDPATGQTYTDDFDRVIVRHGPKPKLSSDFPLIDKACAALKGDWRNLIHGGDNTRRRLWDRDMFSEPALNVTTDLSEKKFSDAVKLTGVRASAFTLHKELRGNGSSTVTFGIDRLSVEHGELSGVRVSFQSTAGRIGLPELDPISIRLGFHWEDNYRKPDDLVDSLAAARDRAGKLDVIVRFPEPLTSSRPPVSFRLSIAVLNGDAMSTWEFEQMYAPEDRRNFNGDPLPGTLEYLTRCVWFPVENLRIRLTLSERLGRPDVRVFGVAGAGNLPKQEFIHQGILQLYPSPESPLRPSKAKWHEQPAKALLEAGRLVSTSPQTWELLIYKPLVGTAYSLEWAPETSASDAVSLKLDAEAESKRSRLLSYCKARQVQPEEPSTAKARQIIRALYDRLYERYRSGDPDERFVLTLMTYDSARRHLMLTDAIVNGQSAPERSLPFQLPFGLGLGGASFKLGKALLYIKAQADVQPSGPSYYVPISSKESHAALLSIPLGIPPPIVLPPAYEFGRQCCAVLTFGSNHPDSRLATLEAAEELTVLAAGCGQALGLLLESLA